MFILTALISGIGLLIRNISRLTVLFQIRHINDEGTAREQDGVPGLNLREFKNSSEFCEGVSF